MNPKGLNYSNGFSLRMQVHAHAIMLLWWLNGCQTVVLKFLKTGCVISILYA